MIEDGELTLVAHDLCIIKCKWIDLDKVVKSDLLLELESEIVKAVCRGLVLNWQPAVCYFASIEFEFEGDL